VAKQWGIERYKDFLITSSAVPTFATGFTWYSLGTILRPFRHGSIIEIKRIQGPIFNSKEEAEQVYNFVRIGLMQDSPHDDCKRLDYPPGPRKALRS
jgi:hypothetical protein